MNDQKLKQLEEYRAQVVEKLVGMGEYLINDDSVDYQTIISLARSTGNVDLLGKALDKINGIEDRQAQSEALLSLLDEVEYEIADTVNSEDTPEAVSADSADTGVGPES